MRLFKRKPKLNTLELWAARDSDKSILPNRVFLFTLNPHRHEGGWLAGTGAGFADATYFAKFLPALAFLRWEDEPIRVRLEVLS